MTIKPITDNELAELDKRYHASKPVSPIKRDAL